MLSLLSLSLVFVRANPCQKSPILHEFLQIGALSQPFACEIITHFVHFVHSTERTQDQIDPLHCIGGLCGRHCGQFAGFPKDRPLQRFKNCRFGVSMSKHFPQLRMRGLGWLFWTAIDGTTMISSPRYCGRRSRRSRSSTVTRPYLKVFES